MCYACCDHSPRNRLLDARLHDDPVSLASRTSAVIFFGGLPRRLAALEDFSRAVVQLQLKRPRQVDLVAVAAIAWRCSSHSMAQGARPRTACVATEPGSTTAYPPFSSLPSARHFCAQAPRSWLVAVTSPLLCLLRHVGTRGDTWGHMGTHGDTGDTWELTGTRGGHVGAHGDTWGAQGHDPGTDLGLVLPSLRSCYTLQR